MSVFSENLMDDILLGEDGEEDDNVAGNGEIYSDDDKDNDDQQNKEDAVKDENTTKVVETKKRSVRNPKPRLNIDILTGARGIHTIENHFKNMKFRGKGYEKQDLDEVLKRLQHWAHRMYPAYKFDDILANIDRLSKKKLLQHHMQRYRQGILQEKEKDLQEENNVEYEEYAEPFDELDALINEQIAVSKLPLINTTASRDNNQSAFDSVVDTPHFAKIAKEGGTSTPYRSSNLEKNDDDDDDITILPLEQSANEVSSKSPTSTPQLQRQPIDLRSPSRLNLNQVDIPDFLRNRTDLTEEQIIRIAENRRLAQERLKAKKQMCNQ